MEKVNLQREVASALFTLPEKDESESVDPYDGRKYKPIREVVYGPAKVSTVGDKRQETKPKLNTNVGMLTFYIVFNNFDDHISSK